MDKKNDICVIGASNIDIHIKASDNLIEDVSSLGDIFVTSGGVGRNIAYGIAALKVYVSFISIFSDDVFSEMLLSELNNNYISLEKSNFHADSTSKYVEILVGGKNYGINDMKNMKGFSIDFFRDKLEYLNSMRYVIFDLNMNISSIDFLVRNVKTKLVCEATSVIKCIKIKDNLKRLYILKGNFAEACKVAECEQSIEYNQLLDILLVKGVEKVYITLGEKGVLYADKEVKIYARLNKVVELQESIGAGDSFMVGIIYGEKKGWNSKEILIFSSRLVLSYLSSGTYKLSDEILETALNMKQDILKINYWNEYEKKWVEEKE